MQLYDVLIQDHETIRTLLEKLEFSDQAVHVRQDSIEQMRIELISHFRAEEIVLYDTLKSVAGVDDLALEAYEEHSVIESLLRELELMNPTDSRWLTKLRTLKESVEHHIAEEEGEIFAAARLVLAPEETRKMAFAYTQLHQQFQEGTYTPASITTISNYMPARFSNRFSTFSRQTAQKVSL